MPADYAKIRAENITRYGTDTAVLDLLGQLYSDRTHFIFELIQNAEDAGAQRTGVRVVRRPAGGAARWPALHRRRCPRHLRSRALRESRGPDGDRQVRHRVQVGLRVHPDAQGAQPGRARRGRALPHRELRPPGSHHPGPGSASNGGRAGPDDAKRRRPGGGPGETLFIFPFDRADLARPLPPRRSPRHWPRSSWERCCSCGASSTSSSAAREVPGTVLQRAVTAGGDSSRRRRRDRRRAAEGTAPDAVAPRSVIRREA